MPATWFRARPRPIAAAPDCGCVGERNDCCGRDRRPVVEKRCWRGAGVLPGVVPEGRARGCRAQRNAEPDHGAAAARASLGSMWWEGIPDLLGGSVGERQVEQPATERELGGALAVGEEAKMPDAVEAIWQGVHQEAADELVGVKRHDLRLAVMAIILPAEGDRGVSHADQAGVGDGEDRKSTR